MSLFIRIPSVIVLQLSAWASKKPEKKKKKKAFLGIKVFNPSSGPDKYKLSLKVDIIIGHFLYLIY